VQREDREEKFASSTSKAGPGLKNAKRRKFIETIPMNLF
jgi:hypothetical protein